jgi:hypothetical protein
MGAKGIEPDATKKETEMKGRLFYIEFNPKDFKRASDVIQKASDVCMYEHGVYFNLWDMEIGKVVANAELYYIKAAILLPDNHTNENYLI